MKLSIIPRVFVCRRGIALHGCIFRQQCQTTVEVAFVLDTTGSMGGLIEGASARSGRSPPRSSIATRRRHPHGPCRLPATSATTTSRQDLDLTTDIRDLYAKLLELKARGGGDWPESVNEALDVAVNKLQWTLGSDARRIVSWSANEPPHMDLCAGRQISDQLA